MILILLIVQKLNEMKGLDGEQQIIKNWQKLLDSSSHHHHHHSHSHSHSHSQYQCGFAVFIWNLLIEFLSLTSQLLHKNVFMPHSHMYGLNFKHNSLLPSNDRLIHTI